MSARLKANSEIPSPSSTSRSRWTSRNGRRGSKNGARKSRLSGIQMYGAFTFCAIAPS